MRNVFENKIVKNFLKTIDKKVCYYCGNLLSDNNFTIDHKLPKARGGFTERENVCICCDECNGDKANMTEDEYKKYLLLIQNKSIEEVKLIRKQYMDSLDMFLHPKVIYFDNKYRLAPYMTDGFKNIDSINVSGTFTKTTIKSFDSKMVQYYKKYGILNKPIPVYKNTLVGGYARYLFCKEKGIDLIPIKIIKSLK